MNNTLRPDSNGPEGKAVLKKTAFCASEARNLRFKSVSVPRFIPDVFGPKLEQTSNAASEVKAYLLRSSHEDTAPETRIRREIAFRNLSGIYIADLKPKPIISSPSG